MCQSRFRSGALDLTNALLLQTEITGQSILKAQTSSPSLGLDGCQTCGKSIEDDCVRLGSFDRWHVYCLTCRRCKKAAGLPPVKEDKVIGEDGKVKPPVRRPPPAVNDFAYAIERRQDGSRGYAIFCNTHAPNEASGGFESVSKLEQYAFLLNVALRRLYEHLKAQGVVTELLREWALPLWAPNARHFANQPILDDKPSCTMTGHLFRRRTATRPISSV